MSTTVCSFTLAKLLPDTIQVQWLWPWVGPYVSMEELPGVCMMHPCTPSIIFEWTGSWLAVSQFFMCKRIRTFCCSLHFDVYIRKYLFSLIFILICGSHLSLIELFFHQSYFYWSSKLQTEMLEHGLYYSSHTQYFWLNTCPWIRKPLEYNRSYIHLLFLRRKSWHVIQSLSFYLNQHIFFLEMELEHCG